MKIFISWSGKASHQFALILDDWLKCVIPNIETFLSSKNIEPGSRWNIKVSEELQSCNAGIICLSSENIMSPWINFEAGALSKYIDDAKVIPLLIDLTNEEISKSPLSHFQTLSTQKEDIKKLLLVLFAIMDIKNAKASQIFEKWWGDFDSKINQIDFPTKLNNEKDKYESLLLDFNHLKEGVKSQIHQFKDVLADLTSDYKNRNGSTSENVSIFEKLTGLWRNPETGTEYFGLILEDVLYLPYAYASNDEFLSHYHGIKIIENRIYGRFQWCYHNINGFFYLDIIDDGRLEGFWFYSDEVSFEKIEEIVDENEIGKFMVWEKVIPSKKPSWVDTYINKKLYTKTF